MRKVRFTRRDAVKTGIAAAAGAALARPAAVLAQDIFDKPLITKPIPSTGERLPVIGIGTNAYGVETDEELAPLREVLTRLPELGGKVIDTAHAYGRSEQVIGRLTDEIGNRDRLFLATKTPIRGDVSDPEAALAGAFERLRTDVIDLVQIHNLHGTDVLMPAFLAAKEAGRIRYIGMSTSTDDQYEGLMAAMRRYPLDFVQVDYSLGNRTSADSVLRLAEERGLAVLANTPFGGRRNAASVFATVRDVSLPDWASEIDASSWAQVFLKYVVSHPVITAAIPGTTQLRHLLDNQGAARGRLPDAALRREMERFWDGLT